MTALGEPTPAADSPGQDAGQLGEQLVGEPLILASVEAVGQHQHEETAGERAAGIGEAWQFVGQDDETRLQSSGPCRHELPIDGDRVFAGDRQQPFGDGLLISVTAEPGIRDDGDTLADQRGEPEIHTEPGKGRCNRVVGADKARQDPANGALPRTLRPDDEESFLVAGVRC